MNNAHLHLVVNHLPIIIPITGFLVLTLGFILKLEVIKRVSYFLFVLAAICTMPAFVTGEGAEEIAEGLNGVTEYLIHEHEEKAEAFAILNYVIGIVSILAIWASWKQKQFSKWLGIAILLFAIVVIFKGREVGTSGGEIRHTEIRSTTSVSPVEKQTGQENHCED